MSNDFDEVIRELVKLMGKSKLNETDYDEVAEKFGTTREEVIQCCIVEATERQCKM